MVELVCRLHHVSSDGNQGKFLSGGGLHPRSLKMVKLIHGFHQESPRVVELEVGLHHGYLGGDYGCPGVVKLVIGLHHGNPMVVKLLMGLHHQRCKKVKFMKGTSPWEFQGV